MSWLFSQALVVASSGDTCSDGAPSAPSSAITTPRAYSWLVKTTGASRRSRSGTTCEPLTADRGEAVLTWCLADSLVKTFRVRARAPGSPAPAPVCGSKWRGSSVKWDRDTCSWKTVPCSPGVASTSFSGTWPRWGTMRNGVCSELSTPARHISANEFGSWPTPNKMDAPEGASMNDPVRWTARLSEKAACCIRLQLPLRIAVQMWPHRGMRVKASFPTPTVADASSGPGRASSCQGGPNLRTAIGGLLNPTWVEWLMGWPLGWTDLQPLEMAKFRQWCDLHGLD